MNGRASSDLNQLRSRLRLFKRDLKMLDLLTAQNSRDEVHAREGGGFRYFMDTNAITFFGNPIDYVDGVTLFPGVRDAAEFEPEARKQTAQALPLLATQTAQFLFFGRLSSPEPPARYLAPAHAIEVLRFIATLEEEADERFDTDASAVEALAQRVRRHAAAIQSAADRASGDAEWFDSLRPLLSDFQEALKRLPLRQLFISRRLHRLLSKALKPALILPGFRRASEAVDERLCERVSAHIAKARRDRHPASEPSEHIASNAFNDAKTILELVELNRIDAHAPKPLRNILITRDRVLLGVGEFLKKEGISDGDIVREIAQYLPTLNFRAYGAKIDRSYFERLVEALSFAHASVDSLEMRDFWTWATQKKLYNQARLSEFNAALSDVYTSWTNLSQVAAAAAAAEFLGAFFADADQDITETLELLSEQRFRASVERGAERAADSVSRNNLRFVSGLLWIEVSRTLQSDAAVERDPLLGVYFDFSNILGASTIRALVDVPKSPLERFGNVTERLLNEDVLPDELLLSACLAAWAANWQLCEYLVQAGQRLIGRDKDNVAEVLCEELDYVRLVSARKQVVDAITFERALKLHKRIRSLQPHKAWRQRSEYASLQLRYAWTLACNGEGGSRGHIRSAARALGRAAEAAAGKNTPRGPAAEEAERVIEFLIKNNRLSLALLTALDDASDEAVEALLSARDNIKLPSARLLPNTLVRIVEFNQAAASLLYAVSRRTLDEAQARRLFDEQREAMRSLENDSFIAKTVAYVVDRIPKHKQR
jgi:hypothetical protein